MLFKSLSICFQGEIFCEYVAYMQLELFASTVCHFLSQISHLSLSGFSLEMPQLYFKKAICLFTDFLMFQDCIYLIELISLELDVLVYLSFVHSGSTCFKCSVYAKVCRLFCVLYTPFLAIVWLRSHFCGKS